jgi:transposase-like protein
MTIISKERKAAIMAQLLLPNNQSISSLSKRENIGESTLYSWLSKAKKEGAFVKPRKEKRSEDWQSETKFSMIIATAGMNTHELSEYCRQHGIYPDQINHWKQSCLVGFDMNKSQDKSESLKIKEQKKHIEKLERELRRKDKALAETAALLVLRGKLNALWEEEEK